MQNETLAGAFLKTLINSTIEYGISQGWSAEKTARLITDPALVRKSAALVALKEETAHLAPMFEALANVLEA